MSTDPHVAFVEEVKRIMAIEDAGLKTKALYRLFDNVQTAAAMDCIEAVTERFPSAEVFE